MSRYADPDRCPDCRGPLPAPPAPRRACPTCGLPLEGATAAELFTTLQHADHLLSTLRAGAATLAPVAAPAPATAPPAPAPAPDYRVPVPRVDVPPVRPPAAPTPHWTVPGILLTLGGLCLVVGALVFLAVTWSVLGVGGRTAVLVGLTVVAAAGAWLSAARGLRAGAETLAAVAGMFLALDLAGAASAGWLGDAGAATSTLVSALVVAVVPTVGNAAVRRLPTGVLVAPQAVAAAAAFAAAGAALARFSDHLTVTTSVALVLAALAAEAVRRTGQQGLAAGAAVLAALLWVLLVATGAAQVIDAWALGGLGAAGWTDVEPTLVAAGFALAVVAVSTALRRAAELREAAVVAACWLVPAAVAGVLGDSVTRLVVVALAAALALTVLALGLRPPAPGLRVALLVPAGAGALGAASAVVVLVAGVAAEVAHQVSTSGSDLLVRADLATYDGDVAAPWTVPLAAVVLAVALVVALRRRVGPASWRRGLAIGVPVVTATLLCYTPFLAAVVGAALVVAALQLLPQVRPWPIHVAWPLAAAWTVVAGLVAVYDPLPATLVAALAATAAVTQVLRTGSVVGQLLAPPLVAATVGAAGWLADAPGTWTGAAAIVAVSVTATLLGTVEVLGPLALATCLVVMSIGVDAAPGSPDGWLTAYLSLTGAGAAAVAIRHRSRPAAWVAAALGVAATWVRLVGVGVETPEAYTLPLAAVLLAFGGWALWHDRDAGHAHPHELDTVRALGPGLGVGLVPTLVVCASDPVSLRALLLAAACAALVTVGAIRRLRAPLLGGALVGAALVVVEVAPYHDAVPRWVLLTLAGVCLVAAGVRWEYLAGLGRRGWGRLHELA